MSYSQNNEQSFILAAFAGFPPSRFLDVGAFHPTELSNTRALYESGWSGVMVEPSPKPFGELAKVYRWAPRITLVQAAVVLDPTVAEVEMHIADTAFSTTEEGNYQKWKGYTQFSGKMKVPAITLEQIYLKYGDFDFVSLDTEGTSVDLFERLLEIGDTSMRPKCICVEHDSRIQEAMSWADSRGYSCVYQSAENLVLVSTSF